MALLELILIFVLQFEAGVSGGPSHLYKRPGHDAILSCGSALSSQTACSNIFWIYNRDQSKTFIKVVNGNVRRSSPRASRLSVDTNCSLVINSITAEDVGRYACRLGMNTNQDVTTYLSVLTISPSQPDADPKRDGEVTLECSLLRYRELNPGQQNSIRWVDETGTVLLDKSVESEFLGQTKCVSVLTVKRQSGTNRRYTCQLVDKENNVKIEADYIDVFKDDAFGQTYIIIGVVVGVVVVLLAFAVVLIKYKKRAKVIQDVQKPTQHPDESESNLTYVTVSHANQASPRKKVKEEEVTYSTVKPSVKTEADNDPSSLYSYVSKPK